MEAGVFRVAKWEGLETTTGYFLGLIGAVAAVRTALVVVVVVAFLFLLPWPFDADALLPTLGEVMGV